MAEWYGGWGGGSRVKKQLLQKGLKCLKMHLLSMVFFCQVGLVWVGSTSGHRVGQGVSIIV